MYPSIAEEIPQLTDKAWLEEQFKTKSVRQVARDLGVKHTTLRGYVIRYAIDLKGLRNGKTPGLSQPGHVSVLKKVISAEDIRREYLEKDVSMAEAATALGCSIRPFFLAMKAFGIKARPRGKRPQPHAGVHRLGDRDWLEAALKVKTMSQIAEELGTSNGNVSDHVKRYGLRDIHYDRRLAVKEGLKKAFPEGRRGKLAANWKGGRKATSNGYVYVYAPEHPHATKAGYVLEHRLAAEKQLGHIIDPHLHVHHAYGDKSDNNYEHIEILTHREHVRKHFDAVKEVHLLEKRVRCLQNAKDFYRLRYARYKVLYGPLPPEETD